MNDNKVTCQTIIETLEVLAPPVLACDWDNVGLLAGRRDKEVSKVYIALDATDEVIHHIIKGGYDMLITHHPIIFTKLNRVNTDDTLGRRLIALIQADIACFAMHTNFDIAPGCMADLAADRLMMQKESPLEITGQIEEQLVGIGKVGLLPEAVSLKELCRIIKKAFQLETVTLYAPDSNLKVRKAAISPGSGKGMYPQAAALGAEVLITGDYTHHEGLDAMAEGIHVIDAGHYGLEHIFIDKMADEVKKSFPQLIADKAPISYPSHVY